MSPPAAIAFHTEAYPAIDPSLPALSTKGKNIIIAGAGSGIGRETAKAFAQSGAASIALLGRREDALLETKRQIEAEHKSAKVSTYAVDMVSAAAVERSLAAHAKSFGQLHVLIANAGALGPGKSVLESSADEWFNGFEVNVKGNFNLVRGFVPHAVKNAVILSTSTAVAHMPYAPGLSSYAASKLAAAKMFEFFHHEMPEYFILNVHPGMIKTPMSDKASEFLGTGFPLDDVNLPAAFMVWAASEEAKFLNGKFVWARWDVDELKAAAKTIEGSDRFTLGLLGSA